MEKYYNLEISVLSCILQKPELMEKTKLNEVHFTKHRKMWLFMKSFYEKFKMFDLVVMYKIINNKYHFVEYMKWIVEVEPSPALFELYEEQLIQAYEQKKQDKWLIEKIYCLTNDLMVGNVELLNFREKVNQLFEQSEVIFKKEEVEENE